MTVLLLILGVILIGLLCFAVWTWSKNNSVVPGIDRGPVINKICGQFTKDSSYQITQYANEQGVIGGFIVTGASGSSTYFYDSSGKLLSSFGPGGFGSFPFKGYLPIKKTYNCVTGKDVLEAPKDH